MTLLELAKLANVEGFMHEDELWKLVQLAAGKEVLEIGSFKGLSAYCMATVAKSVYCVDTFRANSAGQQQMEELTTYQDFKNATERFNNVEVHIGTSEAAGDAVKSGVIPGNFDLIFLDAMHTHEDVKADIRRWWPRVRDGGLMVFHDYGHDHFPGVKQAVDEIFGPQENRIGTLMWMTKTPGNAMLGHG